MYNPQRKSALENHGNGERMLIGVLHVINVLIVIIVAAETKTFWISALTFIPTFALLCIARSASIVVALQHHRLDLIDREREAIELREKTEIKRLESERLYASFMRTADGKPISPAK